jgi:hypothetical protein
MRRSIKAGQRQIQLKQIKRNLQKTADQVRLIGNVIRVKWRLAVGFLHRSQTLKVIFRVCKVVSAIFQFVKIIDWLRNLL